MARVDGLVPGLESGRLEVADRPIRTIGAGDAFGGIALLFNVPRTAMRLLTHRLAHRTDPGYLPQYAHRKAELLIQSGLATSSGNR